jgi:hypothetical protein
MKGLSRRGEEDSTGKCTGKGPALLLHLQATEAERWEESGGKPLKYQLKEGEC